MSKSILPAAIWLLIVTGLSVMPNFQLPNFEFFSTDKLAHAAAYGLLSFLVLWGYRKPGAPDRNLAIRIVLFCAGYGVLMELVQYFFIPGRYCEFNDMVANAVGAVLGWIGFRILFGKNLKRV